jgi:hypothetical protein
MPKLKKPPSKHNPMTVNVIVPNVEEPVKIETNSQDKVKSLKQLIKTKASLKESIERIQLQIEGGEVLSKNAVYVEETGIKDNTTLVV